MMWALKRFFTLGVIIAAALISCRLIQPLSYDDSGRDSTATAAAGQTQTAAVDGRTKEAISSTPGGTETPLPPTANEPLTPRIITDGERLESEGPWMMLETSAGFWFVNASADELGFFPIPPPFTSGSAKPAPQGGLIGLVLSQFDEMRKVLQVYSLTENRVLYEQDLMDYRGESLSFENEREAEEFELDRLMAVGQMAWSSDGKRLAFVSSHMGPSPDVYILEVETGEARRLTSGPSHAVGLQWSPDDAYIFHAGVDKMFADYSGAGYSGWVFYAASEDGSEVLTVGEGMQDRGGEAALGWYSPRQVLMRSDFWWCGMFDMRLLNIETGEKTAIWEDQFDDVAYSPEEKSLLVWSSSDELPGEECGSKSDPGLYMVDLPGGVSEKIMDFAEETIVTTTYSEAGNLFKVRSILPGHPPTWMTVDADGSIENYNNHEPFFSPDGGSYALIGPEERSLQVFMADGEQYVVVQAGEVLFPQWTPDGSGLFYFNLGETEGADFDLYYWTPSPILQHEPIYTNLYNAYDDEPIWVFP